MITQWERIAVTESLIWRTYNWLLFVYIILSSWLADFPGHVWVESWHLEAEAILWRCWEMEMLESRFVYLSQLSFGSVMEKLLTRGFLPQTFLQGRRGNVELCYRFSNSILFSARFVVKITTQGTTIDIQNRTPSFPSKYTLSGTFILQMCI